MTRECYECYHWNNEGFSNNLGNCLRHAPHPQIYGLVAPKEYSEPVAWPITRPLDYCGEFKSKKILKSKTFYPQGE